MHCLLYSSCISPYWRAGHQNGQRPHQRLGTRCQHKPDRNILSLAALHQTPGEFSLPVSGDHQYRALRELRSRKSRSGRFDTRHGSLTGALHLNPLPQSGMDRCTP